MRTALTADRPNGREFYPAEYYGLWSRIEDLSALCGYDPAARFCQLRELPDAYPRMTGRDPEEIAEEHPVQALAMLVRRFLKEYPEEAEKLTVAAAKAAAHAALRPGMAA